MSFAGKYVFLQGVPAINTAHNDLLNFSNALLFSFLTVAV